MRKLIILAAAAAAVWVAGCNTVSGVGRDMQAAGRAVTGTANDAKH
jgi:predicted small secreted protein